MTQSQKRSRLIVGFVAVVVVLLVGVLAGAYLMRQNQDNRNQAWEGMHKTLPTPDWKTGGGRTSPPRIQY